MTKAIVKLNKKKWHEGPKFKYGIKHNKQVEEIMVNVTGSSYPIKGLKLSQTVVTMLKASKQVGKLRVLDFGAGTWMRYSKELLKINLDVDLYIVEFEQAFKERNEDALKLYNLYKDRATIWNPREFIKRKNKDIKFDFILLVNVFNTIPEPEHRNAILKVLIRRLNPLGWLLVYQRIWAKEKKKKKSLHLDYNDGWIILQPDHCTYRARTGATWFNQMARNLNLNIFQTGIKFKPKNTLFRVWEKEF